jgi:hypothetical protein
MKMETLSWILTIAATITNLLSIWLYGNGKRAGPAVGLFCCALFVVYNIINEQWPMMVPTVLTVMVNVRNLIVMSRQR